MFEGVDHPCRVAYDGSFRVADALARAADDGARPKQREKRLRALRKEISKLQRRLYAENRWALLTVFQAMDAAGKDGTIRHVFRGVNPTGCQVHSFKCPSEEELDHDFLWRSTCRLPERGRIGVFNRSYYEEVAVVRVHPQLLEAQRLPRVDPKTIWEERFESIREFERHMARNGTAVVKFWLHVSPEEQRRRFLARIDRPERNWKFANADLEERGFWDEYMQAFEQILRHTSRSFAPWYAIPADDKDAMRVMVAEVIVATLRSLDPQYPMVDEERVRELEEMRAQLDPGGDD